MTQLKCPHCGHDLFVTTTPADKPVAPDTLPGYEGPTAPAPYSPPPYRPWMPPPTWTAAGAGLKADGSCCEGVPLG